MDGLKFVDIKDFTPGLYMLDDTSKAPKGSASLMQNVMISDRKGIRKRPGTFLIGTKNTSPSGCKSLFNYKKTRGQHVFLKNYDDELEYFHPELQDWTRLQDGFTVDQEFGYKEHLVNTESEDFCYMCNKTESYRRWIGATTILNGALVGGETTVTVDGVLKEDIFESKTASASSATTLDVSPAAWTADQWNGFYVYITSGAETGKIRKITDTTSTQIVFDTLGSDPGTCTFQIRMPKFTATGTLVIGNENVAYSAIPTSTTFTTSPVVSAHADNSPVTTLPESAGMLGAPRGNRLESHYTRMIVGNVRSALGRDGSGNLKGTDTTGSFYVSKLNNAYDFGFSSSRVAGEGDVVSIAYGGVGINDIVNQENKFYVFCTNYIEADTYTQDENDVITRDQLKTGYGSIGKVAKGKDDVYFITADKQITSLGRVERKDLTPQQINIGYKIKRFLDAKGTDYIRGGSYKSLVLFTLQDSPDDSNNNRVLLYNIDTKAFEGVWTLPANAFMEDNEDLYYASSITPNVYKMFTGVNDVEGDTSYGFTSLWKSNLLNLTASNENLQAMCGMAYRGYIKGDTTLIFEVYKGYSQVPTLEIEFSASEEGFLTDQNVNAFLGGQPLGLSPLGHVSAPDEDGYRYFHFVVYFPHIYSNFFALGLRNSGKDQDFDVIQMSMGMWEDPAIDYNTIKTL